MAATQTVPQYSHDGNFRSIITPRHGVVTLFGYGIRVQVERGHLTLEDGIGDDRRKARFPRVGHGLRRLIVIGSDGLVSFAALRWLADQDASFVMLERDGTVLVTTAPVRSSDSRLRRAQALAFSTGAGLQLAIELIGQKLGFQEQVARERLRNAFVAEQREWFFEQGNGNCRLIGPFAAQLSETAPVWRRAIAPYAERAVKILWQGRSKRSPFNPLPTRLTQSMRSRAERPTSTSTAAILPKTRPRCGLCGATVTTGSRYCVKCAPIVNRENLLQQAKLGRIATHSPSAEARRSATQKKQFTAIRKWNPSELPDWLDEKAYRREILPRLSKLPVKAIRLALDVSHPYATNIRRGTAIPHPRHWAKLANLAGITAD